MLASGQIGDTGLFHVIFGNRRRDCGLGQINVGLIIAGIDSGQDLTGFHLLIVPNLHGDQIAVDAGGQRDNVGARIGIIGLDHPAASGPPVNTPSQYQ
ncbi:hypothetical protein D3C75_1256810 [compost metagenome]